MCSLKGAFKRYELQLQHSTSLRGVSKLLEAEARQVSLWCLNIKERASISALNFVQIRCQVLVKLQTDTECNPEFPLVLKGAGTKWQEKKTGIQKILIFHFSFSGLFVWNNGEKMKVQCFKISILFSTTHQTRRSNSAINEGCC